MSNRHERNDVLIDMRGRVKHSRDAVFGILVGNSNQKNPAVSPLH